jgi:two-component system alkaline phosphatase synthesis response regulator PhoP
MAHKILIADDEAHMRRLIERTVVDLEDAGVEILTADNGMTALELIKTEKPSLVFLDTVMPKMNGYDVCHAMKREYGYEDVYVIMLTAKDHGYDRKKGTEAGANVYATKPFDPDQMLAIASQVLRM